MYEFHAVDQAADFQVVGLVFSAAVASVLVPPAYVERVFVRDPFERLPLVVADASRHFPVFRFFK